MIKCRVCEQLVEPHEHDWKDCEIDRLRAEKDSLRVERDEARKKGPYANVNVCCCRLGPDEETIERWCLVHGQARDEAWAAGFVEGYRYRSEPTMANRSALQEARHRLEERKCLAQKSESTDR